MGYCAFHLGDYKRAATVYENLRKKDYVPPDIPTNLACCYFYLGMYPESQKILEDVADSKLRTRLLFHLAHKMGNESKLMEYHQMLQDVIEDQLSLASIHYLQAHYQEAIDVYKRILLDNRLVYVFRIISKRFLEYLNRVVCTMIFGCHILILHLFAYLYKFKKKHQETQLQNRL